MTTESTRVVILGQPIPAKRVTGRMLWRAKDYAEYKEFLAWELRKKLCPKQPITEDITIKSIAFHRKNHLRADIDNLLKSVMEALALSGYIANDRQVIGVEKMTMEHGSKNPRIEIEL